ncbi:GtrA family protein [Filifactor villosus]|uniref:GtrA family protein n=1 Tax=Filifactor villosus TaxID=29374 RepID=A0ABV9QKM8_9FIRM
MIKVEAGHLKELIRYGFFGVLSTGINFVLFYILIKLRVHYIACNVLSYVVAVYISYYFNKWWVFEEDSSERSNDMIKKIKYFFVRVLSLLVDTVLLYLCVDFFKRDVFISKIVIAVVIILATYLINKYYVFGDKKENYERIP